MDWGFSEGRRSRARRVCEHLHVAARVCVCAVCAYYVSQHKAMDAVWGNIMLAQYVLVLVSYKLSRPGLTCRQLFENLSILDELFNRHCTQTIDTKLIIYLCSVLFLRVIVLLLCCLIYVKRLFILDDLVEFACNIPCYCVDIILIVYFIIFYSIYCRLKVLRNSLVNDFDVYQAQLIYKTLIESTHEIKKCLDVPIVVVIMATALIVMIDILVTLLIIFSREPISVIMISASLLRYIELLISLSMVFAPVLVCDKMAVESHRIQAQLHFILCSIDVTEEQKRRQLCQFSHYVSCRPFRLRACRVLALDCTLPVTVLSVCVTYLIVCVEFLHLY